MEKEIKEISDFLNITCQNNPVEIQERIAATMVCGKDRRNAC